jgi:hypothetical protein
MIAPLIRMESAGERASQMDLQRVCFGDYSEKKTYSAQLENLTALDGQG